MHQEIFNDTHQVNAILFNPNWVLMTACLPTKTHHLTSKSHKHQKCPIAKYEVFMTGHCQ